MTDHAIIRASFVSMKTMADGTPRITIDIDASLLDLAMLGLEPGTPLAVARLTQEAAQQDAQKQMTEKSEGYGEYYAKLTRDGFFWNPHVLGCLGTDGEYRAWIQLQPSIVSKQFSEYVNGEGRCVAAHVRRVANGSGTSIKPKFACVPLTDAEHQLQHNKGESHFAGGQAFFDRKRAELCLAWAKVKLYDAFNVDSLKDIPPDVFADSMIELGAGKFLPKWSAAA